MRGTLKTPRSKKSAFLSFRLAGIDFLPGQAHFTKRNGFVSACPGGVKRDVARRRTCFF